MSFLGIDIGSVFISAVVLERPDRVVYQSSRAHRGALEESVSALLEEVSGLGVERCAFTGSRILENAGPYIDPVVASIEGAGFLEKDTGNILLVGGGGYSLVRLGPDGEYLSHSSNTACASGTGSFLDQQAVRLGMTPESLALAAEEAERVPAVATRCAVFAKTDIIHLQQEGYAPSEIAAGLCKGLAGSLLDLLLKGRPIEGKTLFAGGVALNRAVVRAVEERLGTDVFVPENPQILGALGAALYAASNEDGPSFDPSAVALSSEGSKKGTSDKMLRPPLELKLSDYPDFKVHDYYVDENDTEVSLVESLESGTHRCVMGVDIGSTSTKALLMDPDGEVLAHVYRKTAGDPIKATRFCFAALRGLENRIHVKFDILGAGTTGSGRKFIRKVIAADVERDEITAHARAATFIDPEVDTILEIGGQDSKFTQLAHGVVYNSVMNYVCAAGTGSFIEEQAVKLGVSIGDYADFVMGVKAPRTSDRCTVFMERDLDALLSMGWSREEAAAAVLHSVRDNYLNKVVSGLRIGERIYFQGATARNKGLISAFEMELGKPITVSPFCHVTGALGICLMLLDDLPRKSTFRGLAFAEEEVATRTETCELCANRCTITVVETASETVGWGFKCGREYEVEKRVVKKNPGFELFRERDRLLRETGKVDIDKPRFRIGYPKSLTFFSYLPFWRRFFGELGCELVVSGKSSKDVYKRGLAKLTAEYCAPIIMGLGHADLLLEREDVDFFLFPYMIREERKEGFSNNYFCPYVEGHTSVVNGVFEIPDEKLLAPVVPFDFPLGRIVDRLQESLGEKLNIGRSEIKRAFQKARASQAEFFDKCMDIGKKELVRIESEGSFAIAALGRPYTICESVLNLDLPAKMAQMGFTVFPVEFVPRDQNGLMQDYGNMYWNYGQLLLGATNYVMKSENMFAVLFTCFSCGPDSYIISYVKEVMGRRRKPLLTLQLDSLGGDAGYVTRIESAVESFKAWKSTHERRPALSGNPEMTRDKVLFIPPMDPVGARYFAAAFRRYGYDARVMAENEETLSTGYQHTLGGECVPCPSTIGSFVMELERSGVDPDKAAYFMATAKGPCRFGQYMTLARIIFKARGWDNVTILSPSAGNAYQGLPGALRKMLWDAILFADITNKLGFKVRPYELDKGATDNVIEYWVQEIVQKMETPGGDYVGALSDAVRDFEAVKRTSEKKPVVGVVGEIYVRSSDFLNQDVCREIERLGGEVVKTTLAEWFLYADYIHRNFARERKEYLSLLKARFTNRFLTAREKELYDAAGALLEDRHDPPIEDVIALGLDYMPLEFRGEAVLTVGRAISMIRKEKARAIVNVNPTFCMPGTVSASIFPLVERKLGAPVINNFYDGSGEPNASLVPHMFYLTRDAQARGLTVR